MSFFPAGQDVTPQEEDTAKMRETRSFRELFVVGISVAAGAEESLVAFLRHMPAGGPLAFLVLQLPSIEDSDALESLLQRQTAFSVHVATDGMNVEPNRVYLSPPNKNLALAGHQLQLTDHRAADETSVSLDLFFHSLADAAGHRSIGVVLSDSRLDGSPGARAIAEAEGMVVAQCCPADWSDDSAERAAANNGNSLVQSPEVVAEAVLDHVRKHSPAAPIHPNGAWQAAMAVEELDAMLFSMNVGLSVAGGDNLDAGAEARLLESEHRMRQIVESAMDAVVGMDDRGLITRWNPKAEKIFRYTPAEAIGQPLAELIIPVDARAAHWEGLRQFLTNGRARVLNKRLEFTAVRRGGQHFPVELTVAANKVGARYEFSAFIRDITQRRQAERRLATEHAISQVLINAGELATATPQILASFCRTLEVEVAVLWLRDALDRHLWCSGYHAGLSGDAADVFQRATLSENVAVGVGLVGNVWRRREPMWNTDLATNPDSERATAAAAAGLTTVYAFPLMLNREVVGVFEFYARDELAPNVALLEMMIAIGHDLGQFLRRTRFEQELADARRAAEAANDAKSAFLANMSHEIRTPMTSVVGLTELLLTSETNPQRIEMLKMIQRSSHHLVELINDILDLSKIESGKLSVERVYCSPVELVQDLASVMAIRAKERGLVFEVAYGGQIPATIYTDPMRLRQILINLVGNAIKFTNEGSIRITLRHHRDGPCPQIEFEVRDTGIGMTAEHLERLFVPFSQADHSVTRRFGGTGLGLCISQRLAHALNGEIRVESQPGVGSSFRLLVAADECSDLIDPATQWHSVVAEPPPLEEIKLDCRVLVAEDTRGIQYLIKRFLEAAGAEVLLAHNGQEAIDQVVENQNQGSPIDVVLMDMHMPVLSGYDAVRMLREQKFDLPIIALTARAMQGDREKCLDAGCDDYLPKPVDRRQLLEAVARQLPASE